LNALHFTQTFFLLLCFETGILYTLRMIASSHRKLVLQDWVTIYLVSLIASWILNSHYFTVHILVWLILSIVFILQWINGIVFGNFGIKVNLPIIKTFFTGVGHFKGEFNELIVKLAHDLKWFLLFFFALTAYFSTAFYLQRTLIHVFFTEIIFLALIATKSKISKKSYLPWLILFILAQVAAHAINIDVLALGKYVLLGIQLFLVSTGIIIALLVISHRGIQAPFWHLNTMLIQQFKDENISLTILNSPPELAEQDKKLVELNFIPPARTSTTDKFPKANIILITMESLSACYFKDYMPTDNDMPYFFSLKKRGLLSQCHIAPSGLTNNALHHLYTGGYRKDFQYSHVKKLNTAGYQSIFLTSQKSTEFNMDKLLSKLGFDTVIDNISLSSNASNRLNDPDFFKQAVPYLLNTLKKETPFLLHLINNQTHGPYFTYEAKYADRKARYLAAVREADCTLETFITDLGKYIDLSNTFIIFTGDHGESFGEEGYTSHANSIIQPQLQVPFVIYHPEVSPQMFSFSTHFDVMPTLLDFCGVSQPNNIIGSSLFNPSHHEHCFVYTETLTGNTPSSFGCVFPDKKIYIDRVRENFEWRDSQDQVIKKFDAEEKEYYLKFLLMALNERGLIF
jgi:glucan phosphoethanolaminetransferase (alkaline phosphatase superfamily)